LSLKLVVEAGSSLRGASAAMRVLVRQGFTSLVVPSFAIIRSWLLRVGYYALTRPLDCRTPWVWLVDHTIQIGTQKLLVILGCPLDQVPFGQRALQLADLKLVSLVPMEQSNGDTVEAELKRATQRTGVPRLIVSDQGSDLKKGIANFQTSHPRTVSVLDVAHYGATLLEHAWDNQPRWQQFVKDLQKASTKLRQTKAAYLLAPRMRPKARFMNVCVQLRFARRVLKLLAREVPHAQAVKYYRWLKDYQEDLVVWEREHGLVQTAIEVVRIEGLHTETLSRLEEAWGKIDDLRRSSVRIAEQLRGYIRYFQPTKAGERFVASTEILESSFGKLKRIERDQSSDGLTGLVLALGAIVGTSTEEDLKQALESTPQKKVNNWVGRTLGKTMQWFRKQFFAETKA